MKARAVSVLVSILTVFTLPAHGQSVGSIADWDLGAYDLVVVNRDAVTVGQITEDGTLLLELPDDIAAAQPFGQIFSCSNGTVQISNPEAAYYATPNSLMVADIAAEKLLGIVTPADSEAAAIAAPNMVRGDTVAGTLYQWLYFPEPAAVTGECLIATTYKTEAGESIERRLVYDATFDAGWNLMAVDIGEVTRAVNLDRTIATLTTYTTPDELPDGTVWVFAGE